MSLNPIPNFYMNGTEVVNSPAMPAMGKLSQQVVCLVGTAPSKASELPYNEATRLDGYQHAMQLLNSDNSYTGTLPKVVEYIMTRVEVTLYVIVVEDGGNDTETLTNVIGSVNGSTGALTGLQVIPTCAEQPTIIYAPSFSDLSLGQKLSLIAAEIKAIPVMDGKNTNKQEVAAQSGDFGGDDTDEGNLCLAFPDGLYKINGSGEVTIMPSGARLVAGLAGVNMWESPQNQLDGCIDNTIPVGYSPTNKASEHNFLNKHGVFTFCKSPAGGIRVIGNRCHSGTFVSKAGLECALSRKIITTSEIYKGKMITKPFVENIIARLNSWIKQLKVDDQCIIDAKVVISESNTVDSYRSGSFYIGIQYGAYAPLEHFKVTLAEDLTIVEKYVEELKKL